MNLDFITVLGKICANTQREMGRLTHLHKARQNRNYVGDQCFQIFLEQQEDVKMDPGTMASTSNILSTSIYATNGVAVRGLTSIAVDKVFYAYVSGYKKSSRSYGIL